MIKDDGVSSRDDDCEFRAGVLGCILGVNHGGTIWLGVRNLCHERLGVIHYRQSLSLRNCSNEVQVFYCEKHKRSSKFVVIFNQDN